LSTSSQLSSSISGNTDGIEYKCLVRAVYRSKKLSTVVTAKDINRFQLAYANLLKVNMDTLKKKAKETKAAGQTMTNSAGTVSSPTGNTSNSSKKVPVQTISQVPLPPTSSASPTVHSTKKISTTPSKKK
jgi:hypothetical protein